MHTSFLPSAAEEVGSEETLRGYASNESSSELQRVFVLSLIIGNVKHRIMSIVVTIFCYCDI